MHRDARHHLRYAGRRTPAPRRVARYHELAAQAVRALATALVVPAPAVAEVRQLR